MRKTGRPAQAHELAETLANTGFVASERLLDENLVRGLRAEAMEIYEAGEFAAARVGMGERRMLAPAVRRDWIRWLDPTELTPAQEEFSAFLDVLRVEINQQTFLGLFEWEGHLAIYPAGSFYKRHVDVFVTNRERRVTFILYLNPDWRPGDGGELRVYESAESNVYFDVEPRGGTLVTFLSEEVHHEVLESHADRVTLTGWFRTR